MHAKAKMAKMAKNQVLCQKWPLEEWRFGGKWQIWMVKMEKIATWLAIQIGYQKWPLGEWRF